MSVLGWKMRATSRLFRTVPQYSWQHLHFIPTIPVFGKQRGIFMTPTSKPCESYMIDSEAQGSRTYLRGRWCQCIAIWEA